MVMREKSGSVAFWCFDVGLQNSFASKFGRSI